MTTRKKSVGGKDTIDNGILTDGYSSRRRNPVFWLVICGILLITGIAVGTAMMVSNFRDHAIESSKRELENAVVLLARHFDQQLDDAEVPLADLIEQIRQDGIASPEDFKRRMSTAEVVNQIRALGIGDRAGQQFTGLCTGDRLPGSGRQGQT